VKSAPPSPRDDSVPYHDDLESIVVTVTDTGPGLTHEQQQLLFKEGVQFNPNELQAGQGSGLGLWISKEIVSLHQGYISVKSNGLGQGSTFEVVLPVVMRDPLLEEKCDVSMMSPTIATNKSNHLNHTQPPKQQRHILVVDDARSNRKLVCRLFKAEGFICHEAENGQECVNLILASEHHYEFILMDYEMPILDGPSAAHRIREHKCDILIIGLTGNVLPEDQEYFIRQGANMVLPKPVNLPELLGKIRNFQRTGV
jgi:CheY-like chemotaxis protein